MKLLALLAILAAPALADTLRGPGGISTPGGETEVGRYNTSDGGSGLTISTEGGTTPFTLGANGWYVGPNTYLFAICVAATSEGCWMWEVVGFTLVGGVPVPLPQTEFVKDSP